MKREADQRFRQTGVAGLIGLVTLACVGRVFAGTSKACRYEIVKRPLIRQLKPIPQASPATQLELAAAGSFLVALLSDEEPERWQLVAWESPTSQPKILKSGIGFAGGLVSAPGGRRVAMFAGGSQVSAVNVYDFESGALTEVVLGPKEHSRLPEDLVFNPTGEYLAVGVAGFEGATVLPRRTWVYEIKSGRRVFETASELDLAPELWDGQGLLLKQTTATRRRNDSDILRIRFSRLAGFKAEVKPLEESPLQSPDGKIRLEATGQQLIVRTDGSSCAVWLRGPEASDLAPRDLIWLGEGRFLIDDEHEETWLINAKTRRAQRLLPPNISVSGFHLVGRNVVVEQEEHRLTFAPID